MTGIVDRYALKLHFSRRHGTLELAVTVGWSVSRLIHPSVIKAFFRYSASAHPPANGVSVYGLVRVGCIQIFNNVSGSVHGCLHVMIPPQTHSTKLSHVLCRISIIK